MSFNRWKCSQIKTGIIGSDKSSRSALRATVLEMGFQVSFYISTDIIFMKEVTSFDEAPAMFLLDLTSHDDNWNKLITGIKKKWNNPKLLVYGMDNEDDDVLDDTIIQMYKAGVSAYIHKGQDLKELRDAIEKLSVSDLHLSPRVISAFIDYYKNEADMRKLAFNTYY